MAKTPAEDSSAPAATATARREAFKSAASSYFSALSYVDIHLRREAYALEESNIIPPGVRPEVSDGRDAAKGATIAPGAMGGLDVGWLNSRGDRVGLDMRAELWRQLRDVLAKVDLEDLRTLGSGLTNGNDNTDPS